jgi:protoporphyrinogen oxidase
MQRLPSTVIIGAGPAGLTAGYLLSKAGAPVTVLEADSTYVGGLSRTATYKGYHFDIGGHRFFSKAQAVEDLWTELLPNDMLLRPRSSRIFYNGRFFSYPLKPLDALTKLGVLETARCILSYAKARLAPIRQPRNFEDWVTNQFGDRLYRIFFKTYTEKVWGMSCREISADWAAQRIKGLSLWSAIANALRPQRPGKKSEVIKTLIDSFRYPRLGPGMMWEACAARIRELGGQVQMGSRVTGCRYDQSKSRWVVTCRGDDGVERVVEADHVVSSAPMRELVKGLQPAPAPEALKAADRLRYRDFLTVVLILRERDAFDDNWIYIHEPGVKVGRIQNFRSWSPEMVPDPSTVCYGLEYFCFEGDGLWSSSDADLVALGAAELEKIGLGRAADVIDGCVVRQAKAYPVYDDDYQENVNVCRREIAANFPGLHLVGRNGMHKYNNQDHAMMTAMLTAENILAGREVFDVWEVNQDAEYHESGNRGEVSELGTRLVPRRVNQGGEPGR